MVPRVNDIDFWMTFKVNDIVIFFIDPYYIYVCNTL